MQDQHNNIGSKAITYIEEHVGCSINRVPQSKIAEFVTYFMEYIEIVRQEVDRDECLINWGDPKLPRKEISEILSTLIKQMHNCRKNEILNEIYRKLLDQDISLIKILDLQYVTQDMLFEVIRSGYGDCIPESHIQSKIIHCFVHDGFANQVTVPFDVIRTCLRQRLSSHFYFGDSQFYVRVLTSPEFEMSDMNMIIWLHPDMSFDIFRSFISNLLHYESPNLIWDEHNKIDVPIDYYVRLFVMYARGQIAPKFFKMISEHLSFDETTQILLGVIKMSSVWKNTGIEAIAHFKEKYGYSDEYVYHLHKILTLTTTKRAVS